MTAGSARPSALPYRPCVGIMLLNRAGKVFVGRRVDVTGDAWQMPQGGIDPGEDPRSAAIRELAEETGIRDIRILAESRNWLTYDYPSDVRRRSFASRYRGQKQKWFAMSFLGEDRDVDLFAGHTEFDAWKWVELDELAPSIVAFKRPVYNAVVAEFRHLAAPAG